MYSYSVYLWAVPVFVTLDTDVDTSVFEGSDWLRANVFLGRLPPAAKCYSDGDRVRTPMASMPRLQLPQTR